MDYIKRYKLFFYSLMFGVVIWVISYLVIPATPVETIKSKTIIFIVASYFSLILGFISFNFKTSKTDLEFKKRKNFYVDILIFIVFIGFLFRWVDLFYFRDMSFSYSTLENRHLNNLHYGKGGLFLSLISLIRGIYFFPFIIVEKLKLKRKSWRVIACYLVFLFPLLEAFLKGTRKTVFEIVIIIIITLIVYNRKKIKLKTIGLIMVMLFLLISSSILMLVEREKSLDNNTDYFSSILNSRYNDLLLPNTHTKAFFKSEDNNGILKHYAFISLHSLQYITHGFFEFNHIINNKNLPITYGAYTFSPVPRFINKMNSGLKIKVENPSPRIYVYLTAFGGLFIDFRWFTLVVMFLFGVFQKFIFQKKEASIIYEPLSVYLMLINIFLLIINYIRGAGIYPIIIFFILFGIIKLIVSLKNIKVLV